MRKKKLMLVLAALVIVVGVIVVKVTTKRYLTDAGFPTKPGTYQYGDWEYVYEIESPGTRSEKRFGVLKRHGEILSGELGQIIETPLGRFAFYRDRRYQIGWLNTLTNDEPVFDSEGELVE